MPRGGYQKPDPRKAGPGGPGKFSKREDGLKEPPGLDNPDMQYGDVGRLRDSMRMFPPGGGEPQPAGSPKPQTKPGGAPVGGPGAMPGFLMSEPSARLEEPVTAGMDVGPGAGSEALMSPNPSPDLREMVLEYLYWTYQNKDAYDMLHQLREEKASTVRQGPVPPPISRPTPTQEAAAEEEEPPQLA